jgi:hypothetical protein
LRPRSRRSRSAGREWEAYEREVEEQRRRAHREGRYRVGRYIQYEDVPGTWFLKDDEPDAPPEGPDR